MLPYVWLAVMTVAVLMEVVFHRVTFFALIPGALVAMLLAAFEQRFLYQTLAFLFLSCVPFALTLFIEGKRKAAAPLTLDAMIGERAVVVECIENIAGSGEVEVDGRVWSARAMPEEAIYEVGEILSVVAIEGVTLICKK